MPRALTYLAALTALTALAGCSQRPWVMGETAETIQLRWYADVTRTAAANSVAAQFCAMSGRTVRLVRIERSGSAAIGRYHCV